MTSFKNRALNTTESGDIVTVGDNYEGSSAKIDPLVEPIVYLEISGLNYEDDANTAGLTRDETLDLIDNLLAVLEEYKVAPRA